MTSIHFKKLCIFFALVTNLCLTGAACAPNQPEGKWQDAIAEFERWDAKNSYPPDSVLFVGSSSIRLWETARCFPEFPVINRGFGGSTIHDVNLFVDRIVTRYRPKAIVFYAGENDIAQGAPPDLVKHNFTEFVQKVHRALPDTPIVFISIKPSGARWSFWPKMQQANSLISRYVAQNENLHYIDLATPLLDKSGQPDDSLFLADKLHLNQKGYDIWTNLLKTKLAKILHL